MGSLAATFPLPPSFGCSSALSVTPRCQLSARWLSAARCRGPGRWSQPSPRVAEVTGTSRLAQRCGGEQHGEGGRLGLAGAGARFTRCLASIHVHRSKRQSSAQHCPHLTEAAGSPGTASMRWPGPPLRSCPPSWPSLGFASRSGLEPCFAQRGGLSHPAPANPDNPPARTQTQESGQDGAKTPPGERRQRGTKAEGVMARATR